MSTLKPTRIDFTIILTVVLAAFAIINSGCETESVLAPEVIETEVASSTSAFVRTQASPQITHATSEVIQVGAGKTFTISLESNPTTGYMWQPGFDSEFLELVGSNFVADSTLIGAPGTETFEFRALTEGQAEVTMIYKRPWEEDVLEEKIIKINIAPEIAQ
jgi:inhibitor of cysteine peptidase